MSSDKHLIATPDAFLDNGTFVEFKTSVLAAGVSVADAARAFAHLAAVMRECNREWLRFLEFMDRRWGRIWYDRLRWRFDDWLRRAYPRLSSLRSVRRFRLYVERLVAEVNGYDLEERL